MRYWFLLLTLLIGFSTSAQVDRNRKPRIDDQRNVRIDEDQSYTIQFTDLVVRDRDDLYPIGFTLHVYEGENYTVSDHTITPTENFNGMLTVPVSVNDGQDESDRFNFRIQVTPVNDPPVITGQQPASSNEDQPFTLQDSRLIISDPDDKQFSVIVSGGSNYAYSGNTITPAPDFNGTLSIPVRVSDGKVISNPFTFQLVITPVNDAPKITGQIPVQTGENQPITLELSFLTVTDVDNDYPGDFTLAVLPSSGSTYTVSGNQVTPAMNFEGTLSVPVTVNDGTSPSAPFSLQITVMKGNNAPRITGQSDVSINEDATVTLQLSQLVVTDADNTYPDGFTLKILEGPDYTAANGVITPKENFNGVLHVNVVVNDGTSDSPVFPFRITVKPVNDDPGIVHLETEALPYEVGKGPVTISATLEATDVDNDSLQQAEVSFDPTSYNPGVDILSTDVTSASVAVQFDQKTGKLTLIGKAPLAEYTRMMRSVKYDFNTSLDLPFQSKKIYLTASDGIAWSEKVSRDIKLPQFIPNLDIPTAFTPNGDFANDTWVIRPLKDSDKLANAILRVYNRSGKLLFESVGFSREWDGRLNGDPLPADSYYYTIDFRTPYTTAVKGIVTILR